MIYVEEDIDCGETNMLRAAVCPVGDTYYVVLHFVAM